MTKRLMLNGIASMRSSRRCESDSGISWMMPNNARPSATVKSGPFAARDPFDELDHQDDGGRVRSQDAADHHGPGHVAGQSATASGHGGPPGGGIPEVLLPPLLVHFSEAGHHHLAGHGRKGHGRSQRCPEYGGCQEPGLRIEPDQPGETGDDQEGAAGAGREDQRQKGEYRRAHLPEETQKPQPVTQSRHFRAYSQARPIRPRITGGVCPHILGSEEAPPPPCG